MRAELLRVAVMALLLVLSPVVAQSQAVHLQIKPEVGDTLVVKLDQTVEMTGMPVGCGEKRPPRATSRPMPCSTAARRRTTRTEVFSRAIVTGRSRDGVLVEAVTDSIRVATGTGNVLGRFHRVRGREGSMELRVASDGGAEVVDSEASDELRALFGQMPAMLSGKPVRVGGKWKREMRMPIAGEDGGMGLVRATFQLDSLGKDDGVAYISMRGTLSHAHPDGSDSDFDGSMTGSMQLDRNLSWITYTHAEIEATSIVRPAAGGEAMRVRTHITQLLKAAPAR